MYVPVNFPVLQNNYEQLLLFVERFLQVKSWEVLVHVMVSSSTSSKFAKIKLF